MQRNRTTYTVLETQKVLLWQVPLLAGPFNHQLFPFPCQQAVLTDIRLHTKWCCIHTQKQVSPPLPSSYVPQALKMSPGQKQHWSQYKWRAHSTWVRMAIHIHCAADVLTCPEVFIPSWAGLLVQCLVGAEPPTLMPQIIAHGQAVPFGSCWISAFISESAFSKDALVIVCSFKSQRLCTMDSGFEQSYPLSQYLWCIKIITICFLIVKTFGEHWLL